MPPLTPENRRRRGGAKNILRTGSPEAGSRKGVERRFQTAENPFADQLPTGLFGIAAQGRDAEIVGGSHAVPALDALRGRTMSGGLLVARRMW